MKIREGGETERFLERSEAGGKELHANKKKIYVRLENVMRKEGKRKRILASLLVFAMLVTMLPMNLFSGSTPKVKAEGEQTPVSTNYVEDGGFEEGTYNSISSPTKATPKFGTDGSWYGQINSKIKVDGDTVTTKVAGEGLSLSVISDPGKNNKDNNRVVEMIAGAKCTWDLMQWLTDSYASDGNCKLTIGKTYVVTAWIKASGVSTISGEPLKIGVRYSETKVDGKNGSAETIHSVSGNSDWTEVKVVFSPQTSKEPRVRITVYGVNEYKEGKILVDDVTVEEVWNKVELNKTSTELLPGGSEKLTAMVTGNVEAGALVWTSSDETVATVVADTENDSKATVNAVGTAGQTATVTATLYKANTTERTEENVVSKASCEVTIKTPEVVKLTSITMSDPTATLTVGGTKALSVTFTPENASDKTVSWTSSDDEVATVDQTGKVTALKAGTATITVIYSGAADKAEETPSATCVVTVHPEEVEDKNLVVNGDFEENTEGAVASEFTGEQYSLIGNSGWQASLTSKVGGAPEVVTGDAIVSIIPEPGNESNHVLEIKNNSLAQVYVSQYLTADGESKLETGKTYVFSAWVKSVNLTVSGKTSARLRMYYKETDSVRTNHTVTSNQDWTKIELEFTVSETSNPLFTIQLREVTTGGSLLIDNVSIEEVQTEVVKLNGITMSETAATLIKEEQKQLSVTFAPENASNKTITWTSSDESVATVDQTGKVTAVKAGTATITATYSGAADEAEGAPSASCVITVQDGVLKLTGITMSDAETLLDEGAQKQLSVTFAPEAAPDQTITWTSSDETVATVDQTGKVTAVKAGTATITATYSGAADKAEGTPSASCTVFVKESGKIYNGDFEKHPGAACLDNNKGTKDIGISGWRGWTAGSGTQIIDYEVVEGLGRGGSHALKVSRDSATTAGTAVRSEVYQTVSGLTVGDKYKFNYWINMVNQSSTTAKVTTLIAGVSMGSVTNTNGEWAEVSYEFVASAESVVFKFSLNNCMDGYFLIDDANLERLPKDPSLVLSENSITLEMGDTMNLIATLDDPDNVLGSEAVLSWSSENEAVATVDANGKITPVGVGETAITVTAANGRIGGVCTVKVVKTVPLTGIEMKEASAQMYVGSTKKLEIIFTPENATNAEVVWSSSDETIATVDENGVVKTWKAGVVTITATPSAEGVQAATCIITVRESVLLTTQKAELTTDFGTRLEGDLSSFVTVNTRNEVSYQILQGPAIGKLELNTKTGSFVYVPKGYDGYGYGRSGHTDTFMIGVTSGEESAVINAEITVKPLADSIASKLNANTTLLITREQLNQIRADLQNPNSLNYLIWSDQENNLRNTLLNSVPPADSDPECVDLDGVKCAGDELFSGEWQRSVGDATTRLLWAYLLTGEEAFKDKCLEYAMQSVNYRHWGSIRRYFEGNLPAAHQVLAIAMVYNWMHDELPTELSTEQLQKMVAKLYDTCGNIERNTIWIDTGKDIVTGEVTGSPAHQYVNNHLMVRMSGLSYGATALYIHAEDAAATLNIGKDQSEWITAEEIRANCTRWLELVYTMVGRSFQNLPEDGSTHEGPGYWQYALERMLMSSLILNSNLGIDMITDNAWLENAGEFWLNIMMPKESLGMGGGAIKFSDSDGGLGYGPSHLFRILAGLYKDETAQWIAQAHEEKDANSKGYNYWLALMFSDDTVEAKIKDDQSNLYYAEDMGIVTARNDWSGKESLFYIRSGLPLGKAANWLVPLGTNDYHTDPDNNAIILYSNGEYLLRTDAYADYKRTANHSTLLVNGKGQIGGNENKAGMVGDDYYNFGLEPVIKVAVNKDGYSYIVGDSTEAYHPDLGLRKFERNVVFLEEENVLLIVDNVMTNKNEDLQLRWFPESKIVTEAYGVYTMTGKYNKMKFFAFTEETNTVFGDADVYITSENETEKAFLQTYNGLSWQNAVAFSWSPSDAEQAYVRYLEGNANEHKFEVNGKVYTVNVATYTVTVEEGTLGLGPEPWESDSTLGTIMLNGFAVEGFESDTTEYTVERFWKTDELVIEALTQSPTATTEVNWDGKCPGTVTIAVTSGDKSSTTTYTLNLGNEKGLLPIYGAISDPYNEKEPIELTYDSFVADDGSTDTWALKNRPSATYDLGKLVDLSKIDVAFNYSAKRGTYYDLYVSADGENWTLIDRKDDTTGASPITTTGKFNDYVTIWNETVRTRYVKIHLRGNTEGAYDSATAYGSIQEISFYGTEVVNPEIFPEKTDTEYKQQSGNTVTITSDGDFFKFVSVEMDGVIVAESNYTAVEGSTVITFKAEYLNSLTPGRHIVTINYEGGASVDSVLTIEAADEPESSTEESTEASTEASTEGSVESTEGSTEGSTEETEESTEGSTEETESGTTGGSGNETPGEDVETGDVSRVGFWMLLMAITLMSGYAVLVLKKERE